MSNTLEFILSKQAEFQKRFDYSEDMALDEKVSLIHTHGMFLVEEVYEMLRELPYHKPWKDYSDWDEIKLNQQLENAKNEWIDILIFASNIAVFLGLDDEQIKEKYLEKLGINNKRQEDPTLGYVITDTCSPIERVS